MMSEKGMNNDELLCKSNVAGREDAHEHTGENKAEPRGISARKSNNITRTLMRGQAQLSHPTQRKQGRESKAWPRNPGK
jgi:hypothetical protein